MRVQSPEKFQRSDKHRASFILANEIICFLEGPPIRGPCGASYRPSENFAISSGHQPFLVEILIDPKTEVRENSPKCLGTIISSRHVLAAGNLNFYL